MSELRRVDRARRPEEVADAAIAKVVRLADLGAEEQ